MTSQGHPRHPVDFRLGNGEELNRQAPRSFFIPPRAEREGLQAGDVVKLLFEVVAPEMEGLPAAERMWVRVLERDEDGYVGALDNDPRVITTIEAGSRIRFHPEHVIMVLEDSPMLDLQVVVSRRSHEADARPQFVYREAPLSPSDSGWCALVGDESPEELDDPGSLLSQQLGFVLDRWPELRPVFEGGAPGSEWRWDEETGAYVPIGPPG